MNNLDLPFYNSVNFPLAVKAQLSKSDYNDHESKLLRYHQFVVKEYLTKSKNRGLLLCHATGMGKTRVAVAVSVISRKTNPNRRVIVLSAKSLESNFRKEVASYTGIDIKTSNFVDENYKFISLNSSNMYSKISNVDKSDDQQKLEKKLGEFMNDIARDSSLENSMLIIDEAHNLFNAITNGAKNALALYDLIMNTKDIQLIFLSGTPIINDPFELVPCYNMLRGRIDIADVKIGSGFGKKSRQHRYTSATLFTEDIEEFEHFFIDKENKTIKNKEKFTNRIYGLSSYYGDLYFPSNKNKEGYPTELETIIEKVPMSQEQFSRYISARILEQDETKKGFRGKDSRFSASQGGSSTYRVKSRQISNYCIPEYALGPIRGKKSREKFLSRITMDDLENVGKYSPKMEKILENINKHPGRPGIVYSQFVSGEGLGIFTLVLKAHGYTQFGDFNSSSDSMYDIKAGKEKKSANEATDETPAIKHKPTGRRAFAVLTGDIDPEIRAKIIKKYNSKKNHIDLLLISGAVAEGIDLKRSRHVHIMEPFWNYARINQVKARAIRYESHIDLPKSEQNVQVYIYLSDYPSKYPESKKTEPTTDVDLYTRSIDNMKIINTFMLAIAESSIDCSMHHGNLDVSIKAMINCKMCSPTNAQLFHPILSRDMELPSHCSQYTEKKVSVEEIILPDVAEKFYYKKDETGIITIYHMNKKLNGYAPLPKSHPMYADIMSAIVLK
jgi:hypothetical protein